MSDIRKEAEEKMEKAIFISADCWLCVFDLLPPRQLGLGISMISHRFDFYVDEHFKTRKWTLGFIRIWNKIGENGTKKMKIVNGKWKRLPIPQIQMPRKVIGFLYIDITFIDQNVIAFLHRFRPLFASLCHINLSISVPSGRSSEFIFRNIWPMLGKNIHGIDMSATFFHCLRQIVPSILNEYPSLRFVIFYAGDLFTEFPCDENAAASDGQSVAKWLFTPFHNDVPKVLKCSLDKADAILALKIEAFKAAFASASSPVNLIVAFWFRSSSFPISVVPFVMTNELTREQLALKKIDKSDYCHLLMIRCPIARDESKWTKWEEEAIGFRIDDQCNQIDIEIYSDDDIGDGLLDATPGTSDQQQQK
ncbi:hypothetical protein niasHT_032914 [Heterodera trifolii]|uniref:Uncharacterized protein n=1 Tax=Heterodera trifolii TaxID=157864 RepID=A0ABD2INM4_9BILA